MGRFYSTAGDPETALIYLRKAGQYYPDSINMIRWRVAMGEFYRGMGNLDSVMHYLSVFEGKDIDGASYVLTNLYLSLHQYDKVLQLVKQDLKKQMPETTI